MPKQSLADEIPEPRRRRAWRSRESIMRAAEAVLTREGRDGLTIEAVAREAGMSVGGLYRHFGSRDALVFAVKTAVSRRLTERVTAAVSEAADGLLPVLSAQVHALVLEMSGSGRLYEFFFSEASDHPEVLAVAVEGWEQVHAVLLARLSRFAADLPHPDFDRALRFASMTVSRMLVYRAGISLQPQDARLYPSGRISWEELEGMLVQLAVLHLQTPPGGVRGPVRDGGGGSSRPARPAPG